MRLARGLVAKVISIQRREATVQRRGRDIRVGERIHRSQVLVGNVATQRAKRRSRPATTGTRSAIAIRVDLAVQLIELMFAVQRRSLVRVLVYRSASSGGVPVTNAIVFVDGHVGGNEDGYGKSRAQLYRNNQL